MLGGDNMVQLQAADGMHQLQLPRSSFGCPVKLLPPSDSTNSLWAGGQTQPAAHAACLATVL